MANSAEPKVKSLFKAIKLLECFTKERPEWTITELAQELNLLVSSTHNMVTTLEMGRLLRKNEITGKYRLGLKILEYSNTISATDNLRSIVQPYMDRISEKTGERCLFAQYYNQQVIYLAASEPNTHLRNMSIIGERAPLYCTGVGKAILAHLPEEQLEAVLSEPFKAFTHMTITDPQVLRDELKRIRLQGYAVDDMEHEYGIRCVAVPLHTMQGEAHAAFSLTGPSLRFESDRIPELAALLQELAAATSKLLM